MMILRAEWTKFRTVRSSVWLVVAGAATTIGLGVGLLMGIVQRADRLELDPARQGIWLHGLDLGQMMFAVLGVLMITAEYATGSMRVTLVAVPRRTSVLWAKVASLGGLSLAAGAVLAAAMFVGAQPILRGHGLAVPLAAHTAWRGVGLAALATAGVALLGLGAGLLIRHTAGALSTILIVMLGVPIVAQFLPESTDVVTRFLPPEAAWGMFTPSEHWLDPGPASVVFAGWVATVLTTGAVAFVRRDA